MEHRDRYSRRTRRVALLLLAMTSGSISLTITTFNILAPVHRNQPDGRSDERESARRDLWLPRAQNVASYISDKFGKSDAVLLQEWWFDEQFTEVFDGILGDEFELFAERRPGADGKEMRPDGMCCLVRKDGGLEVLESEKVLTGPQRIAQIIHCRERCREGSSSREKRDVFIANSHLSFPGDADQDVNDQRQAREAGIILEAMEERVAEHRAAAAGGGECLSVVAGDFNSDCNGLAAQAVESRDYVNCMSAVSGQMLSDVGGRVNLGVTHRNHLGQDVSVDHVFLRLNGAGGPMRDRTGLEEGAGPSGGKKARCAASSLGYLDGKGTRIESVRRGNILLEGRSILSDHRPVTAKVAWPSGDLGKGTGELDIDLYINVTCPWYC
mmetsp:Transcript_28704/g.65316  ORF Transcript_28704/g.65316 Transcript_28704/m.65316 type:complete len:384 (-) Transcript_28704:59-1210(-)